MAAAEDFGRRGQGLIALFLTPSPMTRAVLWACGFGLAWLSWRQFDAGFLAYLSGLALPLCMVCAAAVWALRDKADDKLDGEHLDNNTYVQVRRAASTLRSRSLRQAAIAAMCGILAAGPSVSHQLSKEVWEWSVYLAGVSVGQAIFCYLMAMAWDDQLRDWKERDTIKQREQQAKAALLERASQSRVVTTNTAEKLNRIEGQLIKSPQ